MLAKNRINILNLPSPLENVESFYDKHGVRLSIKRDDCSDGFIGGTKTRFLEYLFYDILENNYTDIVTLGDFDSNQCRIISCLGQKFGKKVHLFIKTDSNEKDDPSLFFSEFFSPNILDISKEEWPFHLLTIKKYINELTAQGKKVYFIPFGCATNTSIFAIEKQVNEIIEQCGNFIFSHVFLPGGSGGAAWGWDLACQKMSINTSINCVSLSAERDKMENRIKTFYQNYNEEYRTDYSLTGNLRILESEEISPTEKFENIRFCVENYSVLLDSNYMLRPFLKMIELVKEKEIKRESDILFIQTGQVFNLYGLFESEKRCGRE